MVETEVLRDSHVVDMGFIVLSSTIANRRPLRVQDRYKRKGTEVTMVDS